MKCFTLGTFAALLAVPSFAGPFNEGVWLESGSPVYHLVHFYSPTQAIGVSVEPSGGKSLGGSWNNTALITLAADGKTGTFQNTVSGDCGLVSGAVFVNSATQLTLTVQAVTPGPNCDLTIGKNVVLNFYL
jgi:hypothetical protein